MLAVEPVEHVTPVQVVELVPPVVVSFDGNISIVEVTAEAFEEGMVTGEESGPPRCTGSGPSWSTTGTGAATSSRASYSRRYVY